MQSHQLQSNSKSPKRIGRGGKRGTTAGRGTKGQKSRSGGNVNPLFQGGRSSLVQQMKKLRGFKSPHSGKKAISLTILDNAFDEGATISLATLQSAKLLRAIDAKNGVRLVAGTLTKKMTISPDVTLTAAAKETVEKAGGVCEVQADRAPRNARKVPIA